MHRRARARRRAAVDHPGQGGAVALYGVDVDAHVCDQLDALPQEALDAWQELRTTLELVPHNGRPLVASAPDGVRTFVFGAHGQGLAYYLIIEHARQVAVLDVQWFA